jgi:hypothetical protein
MLLYMRRQRLRAIGQNIFGGGYVRDLSTNIGTNGKRGDTAGLSSLPYSTACREEYHEVFLLLEEG